jgi:uncharacterized membrane protein
VDSGDTVGRPPEIEYAAAPRLRRSGPGVASFVVAVAAIAALAGVFATISGRPASDMLAYKLLGLSLVLPLLGVVLGIVSVCQRRRYRGLAVAGLTINAVLVVLLLLATVPALIYELRR